jgi:hypothetical protein
MNRNISILVLLLVLAATITYFFLRSDSLPIHVASDIPELASQISLKVDVFIPPIHVNGRGNYDQVGIKSWAQAWFILDKIPWATYSEVEPLVTSNFFKDQNLDKASYDKDVASTPEPASSKITVFYTLELKCKSGEFLYVVENPTEWNDALPKKGGGLLACTVLKKENATWKREVTPDSRSFLMRLPWDELYTLQEIIRVKSAELDPKSHVLKPNP